MPREMERPNRDAPNSEWSKWADAHYPFDGRSVKGRFGFNVLRSEEDPEMRGRMAWALCQQFPAPLPARVVEVPPMPDFGYGHPTDTDDLEDS